MDNLCVQFVEKMCHSWHIKGSPCNLRNADSPCYRLASQLAPIHLIRLDRDIKGCCSLLERQAEASCLRTVKSLGSKTLPSAILSLKRSYKSNYKHHLILCIQYSSVEHGQLITKKYLSEHKVITAEQQFLGLILWFFMCLKWPWLLRLFAVLL